MASSDTISPLSPQLALREIHRKHPDARAIQHPLSTVE